MRKADSVQEQMDNVNSKMAVLRKNQKEMLEDRTSITAVLDLLADGDGEERIPELRDNYKYVTMHDRNVRKKKKKYKQ